MIVLDISIVITALPKRGRRRPIGAVLIGARAVQGVGAAILAPTTLALLQTSFAEGHERPRAVSYYATVAGVAATVGPSSVACSPAGCPGEDSGALPSAAVEASNTEQDAL
jgi:MFS family permease